jgi:hypothetical protein
MRISPTTRLLVTTLTLMIGASAVQAQVTPKMKMTTNIPSGIAAPDKMQTRLGTLKFFDGFPDKETVKKVYDNLDFQRAVQAYLLGLAPVNMAGLREGLLSVGPANLTIPTFEENLNPRSLFLTPNATTPYTWIWINLHDGPLVVEVPPMTLGMIDDFWFKYVTDIGIVGPDKGKGGKYVLLPPGYDGPVPEGHVLELSADAFDRLICAAHGNGNFFIPSPPSFNSGGLDLCHVPGVIARSAYEFDSGCCATNYNGNSNDRRRSDRGAKRPGNVST